MAKHGIEPNADGGTKSQKVPSGASHTFVVRSLKLDARYHDDDPLQEAPFTLVFPNGLEIEGQLDTEGKATVVGVPKGRGKVRYGPDQRDYQRADTRENPDYRTSFTKATFDELLAKYRK